MGIFDFFKQLDINQGVKDYMATPDAVLLDVRTPTEYQKGYLQGAINLPQADVDKKAATVVPSKDTPVYVYCRGGREATMATEKLLKQGYTEVHNLGAMKDAQKRLGLPAAK